MRYAVYLLLLLSSTIPAQDVVEANLIKTSKLNIERFVAIDDFGTLYYINNNVFHKLDASNTITYNNLQLGNLETVNTFNPLKINLFYKDLNTVIILDNRLAEIFKIDFNTHSEYKNITHVSTGYDNTLWVFNQNSQQLELFDYKTNTTRAKALPIEALVLDLKSNYNNCWLLTEKYLYMYNYFGSLIQKIENNGYTSLAENNGNLFLQKGHNLFYLKKNTEYTVPVPALNLLINQFFVTNESLYIYNNELLHKYQIKTN